MELEKIKLTDILPANYNPRKISEEDKLKLRNSIIWGSRPYNNQPPKQ